jgi:hypothetical protein
MSSAPMSTRFSAHRTWDVGVSSNTSPEDAAPNLQLTLKGRSVIIVLVLHTIGEGNLQGESMNYGAGPTNQIDTLTFSIAFSTSIAKMRLNSRISSRVPSIHFEQLKGDCITKSSPVTTFGVG